MQLAILAAGLGSRFGGPKQFFPVGPDDQCLFHYSIYHFVQTFPDSSLILITREELQAEAKKSVQSVPMTYKIVLQATPNGKPRGTADALLTALKTMESDEPMIIINADDYYGNETFEAALKVAESLTTAAAIPYSVNNTLSPFGGVSRAICAIDNSFLQSITETHGIKEISNQIFSPAVLGPINPETPVSMNCFLIHPSVMPVLEHFVSQHNSQTEITIPDFIQCGIDRKNWKVPTVTSSAEWFGMTFPEDIKSIRERLATLHNVGILPNKLW
ncbi:hypothetical protein CCB80_07650 [Armatimonadetes bacterium Uphvl-Ar1]|nr:hypothetical protein CCB80_07650 [Armatimonadetes bacterium Uphvl-Ar1]